MSVRTKLFSFLTNHVVSLTTCQWQTAEWRDISSGPFLIRDVSCLTWLTNILKIDERLITVDPCFLMP